jgi:hypothetical protein
MRAAQLFDWRSGGSVLTTPFFPRARRHVEVEPSAASRPVRGEIQRPTIRRKTGLCLTERRVYEWSQVRWCRRQSPLLGVIRIAEVGVVIRTGAPIQREQEELGSVHITRPGLR